MPRKTKSPLDLPDGDRIFGQYKKGYNQGLQQMHDPISVKFQPYKVVDIHQNKAMRGGGRVTYL